MGGVVGINRVVNRNLQFLKCKVYLFGYRLLFGKESVLIAELPREREARARGRSPIAKVNYPSQKIW